MKLLKVFLFLAAFANFSEGCHYGWPPPTKRRRKRSPETEVLESQKLREFFVECLERTYTGSETWDFQTLTDFSVLDTAWYDETSSTDCDEYSENDNSICWKNALNYYLNGASEDQLLFSAASSCIDEYFVDFNAIGSSSRKKRQAPSTTNILGVIQPVVVCRGRWSRYYDRDDPSGNGDYEIFADIQRENPNDVCENPIAVDARQVGSHVHYTLTRQVLSVETNTGITCVNRRQRNGRCLDYEVRFCCSVSTTPAPTTRPPIFCPGRWTRYYDRDNPSGNGDYETLSDLRRERPQDNICERPIAVDARQVRVHTHYTQTSQILTASPERGFTCVNAQQPNRRRCLDYEVRFCCLIPGVWSNWGSWSVCSRTCDSGYHLSGRQCSAGEGNCPGHHIKVKPCANGDCVGNWGNWEPWSYCSRTCNTGMQNRRRYCRPVGSRCKGRGAEIQPCATRVCHTGLGPVFPPERLQIPRCIQAAGSSILPERRAPINYKVLNRFFQTQVDCRLWTSLRVIQYQNFTSNLRRILANDRLWERFSDCSVLTVPPAILRNASSVDIPYYLLTGDNTKPLLPELLNIDSKLPPIPSETSCLAAVTKSYSPLREAVDACAESYVLNND